MTKPTWHADLGDALSLEYPDKYFDLVISSPFYEDCRTYAEGKEDPGIALKTEEWVRFMRKATHEALRVCKGLVCWVVEGRTRNFRYSGAPFLLMADLIRDGVTARKPMIYERKGIPGSGGPDWVRNDWEAILCFTNGGKLPYANPLAAGTVPKWGAGGEISHRLQDGQRVNSKRRATRGSSGGDTVQKNQYKVPPLSNPGNVIKASYCRSEIIDMLVEERKRNQEALDYIMKDQEEYSFEKRSLCWLATTTSSNARSAADSWGRNSRTRTRLHSTLTCPGGLFSVFVHLAARSATPLEGAAPLCKPASSWAATSRRLTYGRHKSS